MKNKIQHKFISISLSVLLIAGTCGITFFKVFCACAQSETFSAIIAEPCCESEINHHCDVSDKEVTIISQPCCKISSQTYLISSYFVEKISSITPVNPIIYYTTALLFLSNIDKNSDKEFEILKAPPLLQSAKEYLISLHQIRIPSHHDLFLG